MPRLFMHMRHGEQYVEDPEGADYDSLDDAREDAMWAARELMSERVRHGRSANGSSFEIADEAGRVLLVFPFSDALSH